MADQSFTGVGTLVADPSLRYSQSGRPNANFRIAINKRFQKDGKWEEKVTFLACVAWGSLAENIADSVTKGVRVICVGTLEQRSWVDDGGHKQTVLELEVDECAPALKWAQTIVEKNERKAPR